MPAGSSSPIDSAICHLVELTDRAGTGRGGLLAVLGQVADPRKRRGIRHSLGCVLTLAVCAVLAGARSFTAIAEWAADSDAATLADVDGGRGVPSESTFRRTLQRLDGDELDRRLGPGRRPGSRSKTPTGCRAGRGR